MTGFDLGMRHVGDGAPCLIVAEVGLAHEGVLKIAHDYVSAVARAGADAVKFQCHLPEFECSRGEPWRVSPAWRGESATRYEYWERTAFSLSQWTELRDHAEEMGLIFLCSPFSVEAVRLLDPLVKAWKVPSGEILNRRMQTEIKATGKPVILSTGMATMDEVLQAERDTGAVATLQCTSKYPCPPSEVGLGSLDAYDGLSDHSGTIWPSIAAVALGAKLVEVHVTLSHDHSGFDAEASIDMAELVQLVQGVRFVEKALTPVNKDEMAKKLEPTRELFMRKRERMQDGR